MFLNKKKVFLFQKNVTRDEKWKYILFSFETKINIFINCEKKRANQIFMVWKLSVWKETCENIVKNYYTICL